MGIIKQGLNAAQRRQVNQVPVYFLTTYLVLQQTIFSQTLGRYSRGKEVRTYMLSQLFLFAFHAQESCHAKVSLFVPQRAREHVFQHMLRRYLRQLLMMCVTRAKALGAPNLSTWEARFGFFVRRERVQITSWSGLH